MTIKMPAISAKLDGIRQTARLLHQKGYRDIAIELMRISRGEVKIEAGSNLFGMTSSDIKKAKTCTLLQRQIIAANAVDNERFGTSEDDYGDALARIAAGNPRWPDRNPKDAVIKDVAQKHRISESSLRKFMKSTKGWKYKNSNRGPDFQHPDWHPDLNDKLFARVKKTRK